MPGHRFRSAAESRTRCYRSPLPRHGKINRIDYDAVSALGIPILYLSKALGYGGDLFTPGGGDFTRMNPAWLNWMLKGDEGDNGKGVLMGDTCSYCTDPAWEYKAANF